VAIDVCRCLGLATDGGTFNHLRKLAGDEKRRLTKNQFLARGIGPTAVSESGLYKLVMRADSETARPFQDWVTREVLPAIRKTGGYHTPRPSKRPFRPQPYSPYAPSVSRTKRRINFP
jgi:prophage antirepressor-like protein